MKAKNLNLIGIIMIIFIILTSCNTEKPIDKVNKEVEDTSYMIYLYGELHGNKKIYEKELELWGKYYTE